MLVDVIQPGWVPYVYLELADDTAGFISAHDTVLNNYDFDTLVAGHSRLGNRDDVIIQKDYIYDLQNAAAKANREVLFSDATKAVNGSENTWLLLSKYFDAINQNCIESMLPKWQGKLGGVEQFISTHCFTMTQDGRIDPTVNALLQNSTLLM